MRRPARSLASFLASLALLALAATPGHSMDRKAHADYLLRCSGCHGAEGLGSVEAGIPPFPNFVGPLVADDEGRTYTMHVPGVVGSSLSDAEIAAVMNYIADRWAPGSGVPRFTGSEVASRRALPMADLVAYRRALVRRLEGEGIRLADYPWP